MKKFIIGLVTGLIIALPVGVFAGSGIHDVKVANDTKLVVNGKEVKTDVVFGVLDSATDGKNYVSARDLSTALGYDVAWDGADKTITIGKGDSVATTTAEPTTTTNKYTPSSDIVNSDMIYNYRGTYFVKISYINDTACSKGYKVEKDVKNCVMTITKDGKEVLSFNWVRPDDVISCVTYDYYVDSILPLLK